MKKQIRSGDVSSRLKDQTLTPEQCAEQFEMYAKSNPSSDSRHSLRFCAKFLRDFCIQINVPNKKSNE